MSRQHFYRNVPKLGNVAVTRHAQSEMDAESIRQEDFERVLLNPIRPDVPDGQNILWREQGGLRIVIHTNPTPNIGAKLVLTVYKIESQAKV